MSLDEIEKEALKLSPGSRATLAEKLIRSLEGLSGAEIEKLWVEEAVRRNEEMDAGVACGRPEDLVFRDARARFE